MQTQPISDLKPAAPRRARPAEARSIDAVPNRLLGLAATFAAWSWITRQPPQISGEILQILLLMTMGVLAAKLVSDLVADLRGKEGLEVLETVGKWIATMFASLVYLLLMAGVLTVMWYVAGPAILRLLSFFGVRS